MLQELKKNISRIPECAKIIVVTHMCPHSQLNKHKPSLFNAYSGHSMAGEYLDSLGDRLIHAFCGHTHVPAVYGKYINLGSDYIGHCKYKIINV